MIVSIDLDDVLADSLTAFIEFYNQSHKDKLKYEDFTAFTLHEIIRMPKEEEYKLLDEFDKQHGLEKFKPIPGAQQAIKQLSKKHKLIIVTARPKEQEQKTRAWLGKYFPELKNILFSRTDYNNINKTKAELCQEINANIHIEDNLTYAEQVAESGIKVLLFNYPWNQARLPKEIERVSSWKEILNLLRDKS